MDPVTPYEQPGDYTVCIVHETHFKHHPIVSCYLLCSRQLYEQLMEENIITFTLFAIVILLCSLVRISWPHSVLVSNLVIAMAKFGISYGVFSNNNGVIW